MPKTITPQDVQNLLRDYQLDHEGHIAIEKLGGKAARARFRVGKQHLLPRRHGVGPDADGAGGRGNVRGAAG